MEYKSDKDKVISMLQKQIDLLTTFYDETNAFVSQDLKNELFQDLEDYIALINLRESYIYELMEFEKEMKLLEFDKEDNIIMTLKDNAKSIYTSIASLEESLNNKVSLIRSDMEKGFKQVNQSIAYNELVFESIPMTGNLFNESK